MKDFFKKHLTIVLGGVLLMQAMNVYSHFSGIAGRSGNPATSNGETCIFCHTVTTGTIPSVTITGSQNVVGGSINSYKLTLSGKLQATGGESTGAGLNIGVNKGELVVTDSKTRYSSSRSAPVSLPREITHIAPNGFTADGTAAWTFDWVAPTAEGSYTIYAAAVSAIIDGAQSTDRAASTVYTVTVSGAPEDPVVRFNVPYRAELGSEVTFDASGSTAVGGNIVDYVWNFGGTTAIAKNTFNSTGFKTVFLTVKTDGGLSTTSFVDIEIIDTSKGDKLIPVASLTGPTSGKTNVSIAFDASKSIPATNVSYVWDFGDGTFILNDSPTSSGNHIFNSAGTYTVSVAVKDGTITGYTSSKITITDPVIQTGKTGASLYLTHCDSCHGVAGIGKTGVAKKITGASNQLILDAISTTSSTSISAMSTITLGIGDAQLIANYLASGAGTTADSIYINKCELCHGVNGQGAVAKNIRNVTALMISNAVNQKSTPVVPLMKGITLSTGYDALLATFLKDTTAAVETGQSLYTTLCTVCHGANGTGGTAKIIVNTTIGLLDTTISTQTAMNVIPEITALTPAQRQKIVTYLKSNIVVKGDPVNGENIFKIKCQMCHGTGTGGLAKSILNASTLMIENAVLNIPMMQAITFGPNEKQDLVAMLSAGAITKPVTSGGLFDMYCSHCHGSLGDGVGGAFPAANVKGLLPPVTAQLIFDAYNGAEVEMSVSKLKQAGLTLSDRQALASWLQ